MKKINNIFKERLTNKFNLKCRYYLNSNKCITRKIYNLDNLEYFLLLGFHIDRSDLRRNNEISSFYYDSKTKKFTNARSSYL